MTDIVAAMRTGGAWDPASVDVLFEPMGGDAIGGLEAPGEAPSVEVGRVSLLAQ